MPKGHTTKLTNAEFNQRLKTGCPMCGGNLTKKVATRQDEETGEKYFAGAFFGCSRFRKGCNAGYTLGFDLNRGCPVEYRYDV